MLAYAAGGRLSSRSFRPLRLFLGGGAFCVRITVTRSSVRLRTRNKSLLKNLRRIDPASQLLHDDLPLHKWVNRAMIRIRSCGAEGLGIRLTMLYRVGVETSVVRGYRVREAVLISPLYLCPCRDGYRWRSECEIDDIRQACLRFGRRRTTPYLNTAEQPVIFNIGRTGYAGLPATLNPVVSLKTCPVGAAGGVPPEGIGIVTRRGLPAGAGWPWPL